MPPSDPPPVGPAPPAAPRFSALSRSLTINVVLPLIVAQWLLHQGRSAVVALGIAALFPLADGVVSALRRRIDLLSVASLAALVVGIALSFATGNAAFAIAEKSVFTGLFGIVFLASLLFPRPLIFQLGRQFDTAGDPAARPYGTNSGRSQSGRSRCCSCGRYSTRRARAGAQ